MSPISLNGSNSRGPSPGHSKPLPTFDALCRFLPVGNEDEQFWWKLTGRHLARMMHEAGYPEHRQVECLLFHRFKIVPTFGPQPHSAEPWYRSRVAASAGDGAPISYSWRFGTTDKMPYIRNYIEPLGALTGTAADPNNEVATKALLQDFSTTLPNVDLSLFWTFEPHFRSQFADKAEREKYAGPSILTGVEMSPDSNAIDIKMYLYPRIPEQISQLLTTILPQAMREAYGDDVCLDSLNIVKDFLTNHPDGRQLTPRGTTAIDCCRVQDSRVKFYVATRNTSFDHIATVMTLGGRRPLTKEILNQLRELWYELNGLASDFPTSEQVPSVAQDEGPSSHHGVGFYYDIQPQLALPDVKMFIDVRKHAKSDMAAAETVVSFLERHGRGPNPRPYLNVLRDIVPAEELETRTGAQAFYSVAVKKDELDITAYFIPQVYRRFASVQVELNGQRRSRFE
ncbi:putative dimethylallyl tryptophan synthase [Aspergillus leporis]|jgi:DMATS type aromatic prenyltransferase|uniref:Putative dimethylallyl tryptophan synthase n=1 Tax=Aspergillus leporis TaxID=41062 RepID=A0A5N5X1F3_9EURO|nr:putative dimethylallyl tryptophan synthase [Aspergillus leporis]